MQIGFHLTPFWSPTDRPPTAILDEAIAVVRAASSMGFAWVSVGHHWISYPTVWPQPIPLLARLAPESGALRLKTSMLLLPLLNAVDVAENVATLDHLTHGRLDVGVAIGYREPELQAAGLTRAERVRKLEESLEVMKRLWRGESVSAGGAYTRLAGARLGLLPRQQPHPPIEMGAQSVGATRRAARLADAVFFGPQVSWADVARLVGVYRQARSGDATRTTARALASRSLIVGASKEAARAAAQAYLERTFAMYRGWEMQEPTMVPLQLGFEKSLDDWTINGTAADCVEAIARGRALGLDGIGLTIYSLPRDLNARIEYLQMIAEDIVRPAIRA
jgi:alkanesulfonate monooxygenase SsuD/methylene tetrahydromethanopterin reductase-like flavin-dependent oxidoreductase (luciferase family)